eukprot:183128_1
MNKGITKIVFAPNAFKECLSASKACQAMQIGVNKAFNSNSSFKNIPYETCHIPLADGGDGSMDILIASNNGFIKTANVQDPLGRPIDAKYGIFCGKSDQFNTAVIEMAESSGLWRMQESEKNPLYTHTFGTGQLILHALNTNKNIGRVIVFVGGSATNDAGFGMADAFGIKFNYTDGKNHIPSNCNMHKIASIDKASLQSFHDRYNINNIEFVVGSDVNNPLLGSNGATFTYGPQKLSDEWIKTHTDSTVMDDYRMKCYGLMEHNMEHMNHIWMRDLDSSVSEMEGSGAAGGLAAGLKVYLQARMESGFEIISSLVGLDDALQNADLVITGEGSIDPTTSHGKVPIGVATHAYHAGLSSVICVAGMVKLDHHNMDQTQNDKAMADLIPFALANAPMSLDYSMQNASDLLTESVFRICQLFLHTKLQSKL